MSKNKNLNSYLLMLTFLLTTLANHSVNCQTMAIGSETTPDPSYQTPKTLGAKISRSATLVMTDERTITKQKTKPTNPNKESETYLSKTNLLNQSYEQVHNDRELKK